MLRFDRRRGIVWEKRAEWGSVGTTVPARPRGVSISGAVVDQSSVLGVATAGSCVKLVSESVGIMPLKVYQGEKPEVSEARDSWQWFRLKDQPNDEQSAFEFWSDAAASVETAGDAFIWKNLSRRPVEGPEDIQLYLVDPARVQVKRDENGNRYYEVWRKGQRERVPASQILQIRGWAASPGADRGLSTIGQYREALGMALSAQEYASRFYSNGTSVPGWITVPGNVPEDELTKLRDTWVERHGGANAHIPGVLTNGAGWIPTGISMKDAQYVETMGFSAAEVCRIFRVWPPMVGVEITASKGGDDDIFRFLSVDMGPRYRRIELAVGRDPDIFPAGSEMFCEFLTDAALKPSIQARYAAYKDGLQGGWITADEIRPKENLRPKGGVADDLQQTPVGGAPNPEGEPE